jgi:cell division protein FtsQ
MATTIDERAGGGRIPLAGRPLVFQRRPKALALKGSRKRRTLRIKHVLGAFALLAGFFFAVDRTYLFLISWERLTIRTIELRCARDPLRRDIEQVLRHRPLGNILLCDLAALQNEIGADSWVKDIRIQKVFPSTLKIEVIERVPFALLEKGGRALVDEDGTVLESSVSAEDWPGIPVVCDEGAFLAQPLEKWENARACLECLTPAERTALLSLQCSNDGRMTLRFREDPILLVLDGTAVREKLDRFAARRAGIESRFGALESADLRLDDRIIVRPLEQAAAIPASKSQKEAE